MQVYSAFMLVSVYSCRLACIRRVSLRDGVCLQMLESRGLFISLNSIMFLLIPRPKTNCLFTPRNTFILSTSSKYIISFSLFIICFSNTSYFSHFLLLSIPCVFYTITGRQKSLYFYHIKFFISLTLPIMNPINQICNPNIQIHIYT